MVEKPVDPGHVFDEMLSGIEKQKYLFKLYVVPGAMNSVRAIGNFKALCRQYLGGKYELEVIDVRDRPQSARQDQVVAAPTLIKELPLPIRKFVGDLSNTDRILVELNLNPEQKRGAS